MVAAGGLGPGAGDPAEAAVLRAALAEARAGEGPWPTLHVSAECHLDGTRTAEIFGSGAVIWNGRRQLQLSPAQMQAALAAFERADFAGLDDVYGDGSRPDPLPRPTATPSEEGAVARITCRVGLTLDGLRKEVMQLDRGVPSPALMALAAELFSLCEQAPQPGVEAKDLDDGLAKVARGALAPETLRVLLHRKPERLGMGPAEQGFLLRLAGARALSRQYGAAGSGGSLALRLSTAEVEALAESLGRNELAQLPANLWASEYTDLSVGVLNHTKAVQARRFARLTPKTHGERQRAFDRTYDLLCGLHLRVQREGELTLEPQGW